METISRNPELLTAFHSVAREGSYTRAATELGTSKSLLSKRIQALEALLRARLFVRTTRTLTLTEEGRTLYAYSERILSLAGEADRRLAEMSQGDTGLLRLTAPISLGEVVFPEIAKELRAALPRVRIEFDLTNAHREIARDGIDFALRASETQHPDAIARPLGRFRDVLCASPEFLAKNGEPRTPRDLGKLECIRHSSREAWNFWTLRRGDEEIRFEAQGPSATNLYAMMRDLAREGVGVARLPLYYAERDLEDGQLVRVLPQMEVSTHPLYFIYLREEYASHRHRVTKKIILDWFARHAQYFVPGTTPESS